VKADGAQGQGAKEDRAKGDGLRRLGETFATLKAAGRKALMPYLMAGDPDVEFTERLVPKLAEAGADVVELGFPFSDPVADGPVIQAAGTRALHRFRGLEDYLALVERIRKRTPVPIVLMTHYNPIFRFGEGTFLKRAAAAGLSGVIVPDLPVDEAGDWIAECRARGVAPVLLEAPNTDDEHARRIGQASAGFVYLVSLKGVTGQERGLGENLQQRVERFRRHGCNLPLAVGFGISTPEQARAMARLCDGVVVGTGLVSRIAAGPTREASERAALDYVRSLRAALDEVPA
jgi:tryptophan synthase alpha chain